MAYLAKAGKKQFVVVDGKEGKAYDNAWLPVFSPDGKRVAHAAKAGNKQFVVVDGKEGKAYDAVWSFVFSPDSRRVAYAAEAGKKQFVVVDNKEGKAYDGVTFRGSKIGFDSPTSFHYLALAYGDRILFNLVEEKLK